MGRLGGDKSSGSRRILRGLCCWYEARGSYEWVPEKDLQSFRVAGLDKVLVVFQNKLDLAIRDGAIADVFYDRIWDGDFG